MTKDNYRYTDKEDMTREDWKAVADKLGNILEKTKEQREQARRERIALKKEIMELEIEIDSLKESVKIACQVRNDLADQVDELQAERDADANLIAYWKAKALQVGEWKDGQWVSKERT